MRQSLALPLAAIAAALLLGLDAHAETRKIILNDGREIVNPVVMGQRPDGLEVGHQGGVSFIKFALMPVEIQQKFNYDPAQAEACEQQQQAAKAKALVIAQRRATAAAVRQAEFKERIKQHRAEKLAEDLTASKLRIEFLETEIPRLEKQYQDCLDKSTELAGKNVSRPAAAVAAPYGRRHCGYAWDGGYVIVSGDSRAEGTKRRTLQMLADELAETKRTLDRHQRELAEKRLGVVAMEQRLAAIKQQPE